MSDIHQTECWTASVPEEVAWMEATCKLVGGAIQSRASELEERLRLRIRYPGWTNYSKTTTKTWHFFLQVPSFQEPTFDISPQQKNIWHHTKPCPPPALKGDFPNVEFHPRSPDLPPQSWWKLKSWYSDNNKTWVIWAQLKLELINLSHPKPSSAGTCQWKEPFVACHPTTCRLPNERNNQKIDQK